MNFSLFLPAGAKAGFLTSARKRKAVCYFPVAPPVRPMEMCSSDRISCTKTGPATTFVMSQPGPGHVPSRG